MSREYTRDEAQQMLIDHVKAMARFWANAADKSPLARCEGVAFSILSMLDGCAGSMPAFVVAPAPHPDDRAYCEESDDNWWPEAPDVACDIAGGLHEIFYAEEAKRNAATHEQWKPIVARCIADLAQQNHVAEDAVRNWHVHSYGHSTASDELIWCVMISRPPTGLQHAGWENIGRNHIRNALLLVPATNL